MVSNPGKDKTRVKATPIRSRDNFPYKPRGDDWERFVSWVEEDAAGSVPRFFELLTDSYAASRAGTSAENASRPEFIPDARHHRFDDLLNSAEEVVLMTNYLDFFLQLHGHMAALVGRIASHKSTVLRLPYRVEDIRPLARPDDMVAIRKVAGHLRPGQADDFLSPYEITEELNRFEFCFPTAGFRIVLNGIATHYPAFTLLADDKVLTLLSAADGYSALEGIWLRTESGYGKRLAEYLRRPARPPIAP